MIPRPCLGSTGVTLILLALTCRVYHAFSPSALHVPVVRSQYPCMGNAKTVLTFSNCNVPVLPIRQSLPCTSLSATPPVDDANADPSDEEKVGTVTPGGSSPEETIEDGKKVPFRQKLKKMGLAVVLSYGWVSNMSYAVVMSLAWYGFSKKTGLSPLAPDQWKPFLAVYAGFFALNNVIRPFRLALSVGVSRYFDNTLVAIQRKANVSKGTSIVILMVSANVVGTFAAFATGISLASAAAGVSIFPLK